ncbi:class I SAM-dependent methyltransferase [Polaribacter sp. WD7]|uniref:class I SAM-dependent methyltransferase n=1 Tax=Polaribacter sp. WD7 TaxID=2269061 RepID=UPI000DF43C02|nr:class I SAM-dependent methyltransferase [Polaribacter sp. WD7]RCS28059.1 class I SAM-dependent methyltransferase [Polaribacter sp. WD7]
MNSKILHPEVQQFITDNLKSEITKLILKGSPFSEISIQELANQITAKQKSEHKLPTWFFTNNIYFPPKISIEQTSSEITAAYKSSLVSGNSIIDITGGFGVDCYYFSKKFDNVTHCEINENLSKIVKHNYNKFGVNTIKTFAGNGFTFLKETKLIFDCIYIDPSRRNDQKRKVFLLKDCLPQIPPKIDFYFTKTNTILIKVSPILDITNTIRELKNVKEIHVVAVHNEVKELLFLLQKNYNNTILIKTINFGKKAIQKFNFKYLEEASSQYSEPLQYLYEPNAAILKSGAFHQIAASLNVYKLHPHSHLYTSENPVDFPGRTFKIKSSVEYNKKKINKLFSDKKANITTRNFPKTVAQIRKETKINDGGSKYIFFTTLNNNKLSVVFCEKID